MDVGARRGSYEAIERYRRRPLIVYATSTRPNLTAPMASDAVREFIDQIDAIAGGTEVDVLIHSSGGDPLTAWKLMSLLRERFTTIGVLVPYMAFSAATIFAMGANEIVMHPHASLGPIDPQITVRMGDKGRQFAYEDLGSFLHFLTKDVRITEQAHFATVIDKLFSTVDPVVVGAARRASELSAEVGARLLKLHMRDDRRAQSIAQNLNKSFFAHGDAVSRTRARDLELPIAAADPALEALLWASFLEIEDLMSLRRPFNPLELVTLDPAAAAQLSPIAPLALPPDMPHEIVQQVFQQVLAQAAARARTQAVEVPYEIITALVESCRHASHCVTGGSAAAFRLPDGKIQVILTEKSVGWHVRGAPGERTSSARNETSGSAA
jgi:hypothetical protein